MPTLSAAQIAEYAYQAGFRDSDVTIAVAVALAESGGRTDATNRNSNGSIDRGLMQINSVHDEMPGNRFDPLTNMRLAFAIKTRRGSWKDWATFNSGRYALYMPVAKAATANLGNGGTTTPPSAVNVDDGGDGLGGFVDFITDSHTWLRLAMLSAGFSLLILGIALVGWNNAPASVKTVAKAVVLKKVPLK